MRIFLNRVVIWIVAWLGAAFVLNADVEFKGPVFYKGKINGDRFDGAEFTVSVKKSGFEVSCDAGNKVFDFPFTPKIISDVVVSIDCTAAAVWSRPGRELRDKRRSIATLSSDGVLRTVNYAVGEMTERWEWIIELGAVSPDGSTVLAKCAKLIPIGDGTAGYVNHKWAILTLEGGKVKLLEELEFGKAFLRWPAYLKENDESRGGR